MSSVLDLTKQLITVPSTKDTPDKLKEVLEIAKKELEGFTIEEFEKDGVPSLLAYAGEKRPERFKIILNAHLDVVPGREEQYAPVEQEGKLWGRGVSDMKGAAAAEILVFKNLAKTLDYPLGLQLVTDEEVGGYNGTGYQIQQGVRADFAIAGEPTDYGVNTKAKGIVWAKIKATGKTAHGAYPWRGVNALGKIKEVLDRLEKDYPVPLQEEWKTTVNVAKIYTPNETFNKIPDSAELWLDIRYIPEDPHFYSKTEDRKLVTQRYFDSILPEGVTLDIAENDSPQFTDENNVFVQSLSNATKQVTGNLSPIIVKHGASDIRIFNEAGCDGVTFGPISGGLHTDEEWASIASLEEYYHILETFLKNL
ncbi:M20/M25/M40 family metallo-hydrolase [Candidatus Roizmanbacteria bacterium]|nr:M20/M25/M40 family metallo-hydrolase [Candidatus Roizmanbacteria bacterium]